MNHINPHVEILTVKQAADIMGIKPARYYQLYKKGMVPGVTWMGRNIIVPRAALLSVIDKSGCNRPGVN